MKAPTVCTMPGCGELVERGRCPAHRKRRDSRPSKGGRGYPPDWKRKRARFLAEHPWCECDECMALPIVQRPRATVADHRIAVADGGTHDESNLRAMSASHHGKRTARDQPGGWNSLAQRDRLRAGRVVARPNPGRDQRKTGM